MFQETADKVVLVVQMKNYKKEDIKFVVSNDKDEYLLEWTAGEETKIEHLRLKVDSAEWIKKVDVVQRVGFITFMVVKDPCQKGKYWQKESVQSVKYDESKDELGSFRGRFGEL